MLGTSCDGGIGGIGPPIGIGAPAVSERHQLMLHGVLTTHLQHRNEFYARVQMAILVVSPVIRPGYVERILRIFEWGIRLEITSNILTVYDAVS